MTKEASISPTERRVRELIQLGLTDEQVERTMALFQGCRGKSQVSIGRIRSQLIKDGHDVLPEHVVNGGWRDNGDAFSRQKRIYAERMLEAGLTDEMIVGALRREFYEDVPEPRHVADLRARLIQRGREISHNAEARAAFEELYRGDLGEPHLLKSDGQHRSAAELIEAEAPHLGGKQALAWLAERGFQKLDFRRLKNERSRARYAQKAG